MAITSQPDEHRNRIECLDIKALAVAGALKGVARVRLGGVTIHECRILQPPGKRAWVSLPQKEYTTKSGERKFSPIIELSEPLMREVSRVVLKKWDQEEGPDLDEEGPDVA